MGGDGDVEQTALSPTPLRFRLDMRVNYLRAHLRMG